MLRRRRRSSSARTGARRLLRVFENSNLLGSRSALPVSRGANIAIWARPVYCAWGVRDSPLVGNAKRSFRLETMRSLSIASAATDLAGVQSLSSRKNLSRLFGPVQERCASSEVSLRRSASRQFGWRRCRSSVPRTKSCAGWGSQEAASPPRVQRPGNVTPPREPGPGRSHPAVP